MHTLNKTDAGVLELAISGKIDAAEMRAILDAFFRETEGMEKIDCLYLATDVEVPTLAAISVEMGYLPRLFGLVRKLDKIALVANQAWIRAAAKVESALIPGLVIETFDPEHEADARTWLAAA